MAYFGAPAGHETLNDVPALLMVGDFGDVTPSAWLGAADGTRAPGGGGFAIDEGVEKGAVEIGEGEGFGVVVWAVGEAGLSGKWTGLNIGRGYAWGCELTARLVLRG